MGHELGGLSATARPCSPRRCRQDGSSCSGSSSSCSKDIGPSTSSTAPALPTASSCRQEAAALAGCAAVSEQQGSPCPNKQLADDCSPQVGYSDAHLLRRCGHGEHGGAQASAGSPLHPHASSWHLKLYFAYWPRSARATSPDAVSGCAPVPWHQQPCVLVSLITTRPRYCPFLAGSATVMVPR